MKRREHIYTAPLDETERMIDEILDRLHNPDALSATEERSLSHLYSSLEISMIIRRTYDPIVDQLLQGQIPEAAILHNWRNELHSNLKKLGVGNLSKNKRKRMYEVTYELFKQLKTQIQILTSQTTERDDDHIISRHRKS